MIKIGGGRELSDLDNRRDRGCGCSQHPSTASPVVPLRLVIDVDRARECYDDYVGDVEWYRENGQLDADNPDVGYRTGVPEPFEEYLAGWVEGIVEEVTGGGSRWWRVERA